MSRHPATAEFELGRQAWRMFEGQQFDAACRLLEMLAQNAPDNPLIRMDLAAVLHRCGRVRDSTTQLLEAARLPVLEPGVSIQLARRLVSEGEIVAARSCLDRVEELPDPGSPLLAEQAHLRWMMKDVPAARRMIDRAVAAGADSPHDRQLQALLMQFAGDFDEANLVLDECMRRWPTFGSAALAQANLRRQTPALNHLDLLHARLGRLPTAGDAPASLANRAAFEAALFKELDDIGRYDEAWPALARCNALMRRVKPYDGNVESATVDALIKVSTSLSRRSSSREPEPGGSQPIFIVGLPRSGTTLLERMLCSHSQIESAGEIPDLIRQLRWLTAAPSQNAVGTLKAVERSAEIDLAELGARYLLQTRWRAQGRRYYVDKLPGNIRMLAHIRQALPQARVLHVLRDPMDVCFSNLSMMFGQASAYSYDQQSLAHYYAQHMRLRHHWLSTMPDAMLEIYYADLVREPEATMHKVLDYCGLDMEESCLHPERNPASVATPSSVQVREPIHTRNFGCWHRYAQHLQVLRNAVAGIAIHALA